MNGQSKTHTHGMRLELPPEILDDQEAFEILTVWSSKRKVKIITGTGMGLESALETWGEIIAAILLNGGVALSCSDYKRFSILLHPASLAVKTVCHWLGQ